MTSSLKELLTTAVRTLRARDATLMRTPNQVAASSPERTQVITEERRRIASTLLKHPDYYRRYPLVVDAAKDDR